MSSKNASVHLRALAVVGLAIACVRASADVRSLQDCVQVAHPAPLAQLKSGSDPVGSAQDVGNVTVMEISGDYSRGGDAQHQAPRQAVASRFLASHPDRYDFIVVFTTFEFPTGEALAFYNPLRNDIAGIGQPMFDQSNAYGSTGKLQGYVDMAAMSRYSFSEFDPAYHVGIDTLAHEIMHRWSSYIHFIDGFGQNSAELLGRDTQHWNYFLDTDASVMYGSDWQAQADGTFRSVDVRHRYSPLDLYLAGLAAPSEVPPFTLIRNGTGASATDLPNLGATSAGSAETISIEQIIEASGTRLPAAATAQRNFNAALILLKRPGENVPAERVLELERFRLRFQQQLSEMTDGRAMIRIFTQQRDGATGLPAVLHGSGMTTSPGGVATAVSWLEARQDVDGHWEDRPATALRDTVAVKRALEELDPAFPGLVRARAWLADQPTANLDQRSWKLVGASLNDDSVALAASQDVHGGFAIEPGWSASSVDTALIAAALANHGHHTQGVGAALQSIGSRQNADGSFGIATGGRGHLLPTLRVASLLSSQSDNASAQRLGQVANWIETRRAQDGGIGSPQQGSLTDTVDVYSLSGRIAFLPETSAGIRGFIRRNQQVDGDWGGSIYLTATAALAYAHDQRPNLALVGAPSVIPTPLHDGERAALGVTISNTGNVPIADTKLRWYDGDPDQGGAQIGADVVVPNLAAGSRTSVTQYWNTDGLTGAHELWVVLDATGAVAEASELDNRGHVGATVLPPSTQPDLALASSDFALVPSSVSTLPSLVHLTGALRNIGGEGAASAVVRLYAKPDLDHALAETTVDVPARGTASIDVAFNATAAAALNLLLRADPDAAIAEASETNNDAEFTLPFGESLDLEVSNSGLALVTAPALVGHDLEFDAVLRNRGTVDSPPVMLHADVVQGGTTSTIFDGLVQVSAGQSVHRHLSWQSLQSGAAQLHVVLDPSNQVPETDEGNNSGLLDFSVDAATDADLTFVGDSLVLSPTPAMEGQPFTATLGVRNLSSVATSAFRVALYAADPHTGAAPIGSTMVSSLLGSSQASVSITVADLLLRGDQRLFVQIDADDEIAESDEANNTVVQPLRVLPLPDLAISVADVTLSPPLPAPGQAVLARVTVRNLGGQDAHDVSVRLLEGDVTSGVPVGADISAGTLPAGASTTLVWNWTLGVAANARSVTAAADPGDTVREGNASNNAASLPFDVQDSDFFASERYISPNGDGVQDAAVVVFRLQQPGSVEVNVVSSAQYAVRHFTDVALNGDLRGQVLWDGRDDRGRIVPDGDYRIEVAGAVGHRGDIRVTVDNNHSSLLEAVDTPHGIYGALPPDMWNLRIPPPSSPLHDQVFGLLRTTADATVGLYRTDTVYPSATPVISGVWIDAFNEASHSVAALADFAFSQDGNEIVATLQGQHAGRPALWVVRTAVDQIDAPVVLAEFDDVYAFPILGYFDSGTIVVGPDQAGMLDAIDVASHAVSPIRGLDGEFTSGLFTVIPLGVLHADSALPDAFVPRDPAKPVVRLRAMQGEPDEAYDAQVSPMQQAVAVYHRGSRETIELVDLASGARTVLADAPTGIAHGELSESDRTIGHLGMGWLRSRDQLVIADALTSQLSIHSASGQRLSLRELPSVRRVGSYLPGGQEAPVPFDAANVFPTTFTRLGGTPPCGHAFDDVGVERRIFDPARNLLYVESGEDAARDEFIEGWELVVHPGIRTYLGIDADDGAADLVHRGTLLPLQVEADRATYPLFDQCQGSPSADWPELILRDGANIRADGRVQTLGRGLLPEPWPRNGALIEQLWADDARALLSDGTVFTTLQNLQPVLRARTLGRGIELSGIAADRNFASYRIEWAPIEDQSPTAWQALLPSTPDEVFMDEFVTWVPPRPGTFAIRLIVVDKAGNSNSTQATASSFDSSVIDNFTLLPRSFSPNGDGVKDVTVAKYRVRTPATLAIRITDVSGLPVRSVDLTYGAADIGTQEFGWDGRNDSGQRVPDARYRLSVDGFAAWVTLDTVAPELGGDVPPAYVRQTPRVEVMTQVHRAARDRNAVHLSLEAAPVGSVDWFEVNSWENASLGSSADPLDPRNWLNEQLSASTYAGTQFRLVATDPAGNVRMLAIGRSEDVLALEKVHQSAEIDAPPVASLGFYYTPPPFDAVPDTQGWRPIFVERDAAGNRLVAANVVPGLARVAVETADAETPQQWVERGIYPLGDELCGAWGTCLQRQPGELRIPFDVHAMPAGSHAFVRLRGERSDGSRVYSNQGYIQIGGIDGPLCEGALDGIARVRSIEYVDGPLIDPTLHYVIGAVEHSLAAERIDDGSISFDLPWDGHGPTAWVTGTDATGLAHRSPSVALTCTEGVERWETSVRRAPVVRDQCDGQPSNQIQLGMRVAPLPPGQPGHVEPQPQHIRFSYVDARSGVRTILHESDGAQALDEAYTISTEDWPEGHYSATMEIRYVDNTTFTRTIGFPVTRQPPAINIASPRDGERVCALPGAGDKQQLPVSVDIHSVVPSGYRLGLGLGPSPSLFSCEVASGEQYSTPPDDRCPSYDSISDFELLDGEGISNTIEDHLAAYNGTATLQMKGVSWSGGTVCEQRTFLLDSTAELSERSAPRTVVSTILASAPVVGISTNGNPNFALGSFFLRADEPMRVDATLHRAHIDESTRELQLDSESLGTLLHQDALDGDIDVAWNGVLDDHPAPDGLYGVAINAGDDCSNTRRIIYGALLDSAAPEVHLTAPAANSIITSAVVEISGSVQDNVRLIGWQLDFATAASPGNWQRIESGTLAVPIPSVLKSWLRGSLAGAVDIRLTATDAMGNRSEAHLPLILGEASVLIGGAEAQPMLFSPNGDGVLEATRVQLNLLRGATVDLRVLDAAGGLVENLYTGPQAAGSAGYAWGGEDIQGHPASDATYKIRIQAHDGAALAESAELSVIIDTIPPVVEITRPAGAFASSASSVELRFDDAHFASYEARLTRMSDGVQVAAQAGTQSGSTVLTTLAILGEGRYALHAEARDAAGNATVRDSEFELDATAPVVTLDTPAEAGLIPSASATSVVGSVSDAHLASYSLAVAPEHDDTWTELKQGADNLAHGELLAWQPDLPDGHYRLRLRAVDRAGNTKEIVHAIEIDGTPPVALITTPVDGGYLHGNASVEGTATDTNFAIYRLSLIVATQASGGQWSDIYTGSTPVDAGRLATLNLSLPENDYLLRLIVTDGVGLSSSAQVHVRIDTQPPAPPLNLTGRVDNNRDAVLDWAAVQAGDLAGYIVYRGSERITASPVVGVHYVDAGAPEGALQYRVRAVDAAGNESAPSNPISLLIDHTPPTAQIARPLAAERVHGSYEIVGTAYSNDDFKQYRLSAQVLNRPAYPVVLASSTLAIQGKLLATWNTLAADFHEDDQVRLRLDAEDVRGNATTATVDVAIDNTPPAAPTGLVAALVGADGQLHWNPNGEADLLGYLLYRDNQLVNATGPNLPADLRPFALDDVQYLDAHVPDGQHSYVTYAIDRAGNVSLPSNPATLDPLDNTPPSMTIETPADGTRFESGVTVLATSRDTDIAEVRYSYRALGASDWLEIGAPLGVAPYRITWTPVGGIPYGTYQIRAVARDAGGRYDPAPPVVTVVYADLTPPPTPTNLVAHAEGNAAHLTWTASSAADLAGYRIYRNGAPLSDLPATAITLDDAQLDDGHYDYIVVALDSFGNVSPQSTVAPVEVFGILMEQPFTPMAQATVDLAGLGARSGNIALHVETNLGSFDAQPGATSNTGAISLPAIQLAMGSNHFTMRVSDAAGNISRPAEIWVDRGAIPAAPTGLIATIDDHQVELGWSPGSEADLLGYRVFRNGIPLSIDGLLGELPMASSASGSNAAAAVDGDPHTYWETSVYNAGTDSPDDPALELAWVEPRIIVDANLAWASAGTADGSFDVDAWSGHAWVRIAHVRGTPQMESTIAFSHPYRTTRIRLVLRSAAGIGNYSTYQLAELRLSERPVQGATTLSDAVTDGSWQYRVSTVSAYAFESALSDAANAGVGDTQGPDAVVLSGGLVDNAATLVWTASSASDVSRYELQRDGQTIATIAAGIPLEYVDSGLLLGAHTYVVRAYDGFDNEGPPSNIVILTVVGDGPAVPAGLVVSAPPQGSALDIAWQAGGGAVSSRYVLRRATSSNGPFAVVVDDLAANSYQDSPLANGTTYYYTVEAIDAVGNASGPSAPASGTPRDRVAPSVPVLTYPTLAGESIATLATTTDVCGLAEPGSAIDIDRAGITLATVTASADYSAEHTQVFDYGMAPMPAPSGMRIAAVDGSGIIRVNALDNSVAVFESLPGTRLASWALRGEQLYYVSDGSGEVLRWEPGHAPDSVPSPISSISAFSANARGSIYAAAGIYVAADGAVADGVWLFDAVGGVPRRIGTIESSVLVVRQPLRWSPDGSHMLVADTSGSIHLVDVATAQIMAVLSSAEASTAAWSSDSKRVAYARANASGASELREYELATATDAIVQLRGDVVRALAWSPAGGNLAVLTDRGLEVVGANGDGLMPMAMGDWTSLTWTASGRIVAGSTHELYLVDPPGWFCTRAAPLAGGVNLFAARATDGAGNHGFGSAPIEVDVPTDQLPDLTVDAADIFVVPTSGTVGQDFSVLVTLHNDGTTAVEHPELAVTLVAPDGRRTALDTPPLPPLAGNEAQSVTYHIGALAAPGNYRIDVAADPAQRVRESDEGNNAASKTLTVSANGAPVLDLDLTRAVFAPDQAVVGIIGVTNTGSSFSGHVHLDVQDGGGTLVDDLGDVPVGSLAFGQYWSTPLTWNPAGVLAATYHMHARLFDAANAVVGEQNVAFSIEAVRHIQLALAPDTPTQVQGQPVVAHSVLTFIDGNAFVDAAILRLTVLDASATEIWRSEQAIGTLLPGYELVRDDLWPTTGRAEGVYTLRLSLLSPDYTATVDATVTVSAAAPTIALTGSLVFEPGTTLVAGQGALLHARVANQGATGIAGLQTRVRIVAEPGQTPAGELADAFDLGAGQSHETAVVLTAPPLSLVGHAAVLEARLPTDTVGEWRLLARQGFAVVDGLPPTIEVLVPRVDRTQPAVVPFSARILDLHSGIAKAEISVDAGTWQPVSAGADGLYSRGLSGLIDGMHTLSVRARDGWGNEAQTASLPFNVDASPPSITIEGVVDGAVLGHAVMPVITISDAHLATSEIRLDESVFTSGTAVGIEGTHVLIARATDEAGNASVRFVRFTIDQTAPTITIVAPLDGAVVTQADVDVDVLTEPSATVALATGSYQAGGVADAQGHALFPAVPLVNGSNAITASALDGVGNVGGPVTIQIDYQPAVIGPLSGSMQPQGSELAYGSPLGVHLDVQNPNAVALAGQHLRVRVLDPALVPLGEQALDHDFGAHETFATNLVFPSDGWPLGALTLVLELQQGGNWIVLDTRTIELVDRTPPLLAVMEPHEGDVVRAPLAVRATASDPLSGIATVEANIDGGGWSLLVEGAAGAYESAPLVLLDGDHLAAVRSHDGAGNLAEAASVHFAVDTLPPLISIAGIGDGDLLNHPATPVISVADPHLFTSDIRLNGQPYVSGTAIAASGDYRIDVLASDSAGNTASTSVQFTLDFDAPIVTFTAPVPDSVVATPSVDVSGQTEALASVHLTTATFSVDTTADADGHFQVIAVPLQVGSNALVARATDRAGNVGPEASVAVTYQPAQAAVAGGILALANPYPLGEPLAASYAVQNIGAVALPALPLRFELRAAASGNVLITDVFAADLPIGGLAEGTRILSTANLSSGEYTLTLSANVPASGWSPLDSAALTLVVQPCRRGDAIFADGFDGIGVVRDGLIFCDGFEPVSDIVLVSATREPWIATTAWLAALSPEAIERAPYARARPNITASSPPRPSAPRTRASAALPIAVPSMRRAHIPRSLRIDPGRMDHGLLIARNDGYGDARIVRGAAEELH